MAAFAVVGDGMQVPGDTFKVVVADQQPIVRSGVKYHLASEANVEIVAEYDDVSQLYRDGQVGADLIIMDCYPLSESVSDAISRVKSLSPETKVLIFTMSNDPIDVQVAISEGASGYVLKSAQCSELIDAVRVVLHGGSYLPRQLLDCLIEAVNKSRSSGNMFGLTSREIDILSEIGRGLSNKEIARKFDISVRTVETHRQNIRAKTTVTTNSGLMRVASHLGLLETSDELR